MKKQTESNMNEWLIVIIIAALIGYLIYSGTLKVKVEPVPEPVPLHNYVGELNDMKKTLMGNVETIAKYNLLMKQAEDRISKLESQIDKQSEMFRLQEIKNGELTKATQRHPTTIFKFEGTIPVEIKSLPKPAAPVPVVPPPADPKNLRKQNGVKKADLFAKSKEK